MTPGMRSHDVNEKRLYKRAACLNMRATIIYTSSLHLCKRTSRHNSLKIQTKFQHHRIGSENKLQPQK